jgi:hypothetical protein
MGYSTSVLYLFDTIICHTQQLPQIITDTPKKNKNNNQYTLYSEAQIKDTRPMAL